MVWTSSRSGGLLTNPSPQQGRIVQRRIRLIGRNVRQHKTSRRILLQASLAGLANVAAGAALGQERRAAASPILGCYVGNPNGNDVKAMRDFEQDFDRFAMALGSAPAFMNVFTDFSR